jgi:hypothetical protein
MAQFIAFTRAVAVIDNPGTVTLRAMGPHVFSDFSTHSQTGMFTRPTCPAAGADLTNGGASCMVAIAR